MSAISSCNDCEEFSARIDDISDPDVAEKEDGYRIHVALTADGLAIACMAHGDKVHGRANVPIITRIDHAEADGGQSRSGALDNCVTGTLGVFRLWISLSKILVRAMRHGCTEQDPFIRHVAIALCLMETWSGVGGGAVRPVHGGLTPWQANMAKEMLGRDLQKPVGLKEVALACGLSVSHFGRAFKYSFGMPPHRWVVLQRLELAKKMLAEGQSSLAEIAGDCGFSEQAHLTHIFSRRFGISPGAWRRNLGGRAKP
jgi:AraC-like DNA-binding protein